MARFDIIDATTGAVKYSGAPKYNGVYCKPSYLEFTEIASHVPIDWKVGDYVVYSRTGLTYRLYDIPQPKKQSRRTEYGGAFVYQNVQFFADTKQLEIEPFRDIVLGDNDIHFSTRESWSVWTNVANLLERMQAVMNASSSARFTFRLVDATQGSDLYELLHNNYQDFAISGDSVLAGLEKIYEQWGNIGWLHTVEDGVNIIMVGIPPVRVSGIGSDTSEEFIYGKGHALTSLRKTALNRNELRTRLFVYGSTRNMIPRYYNNLTPRIKDHDSVDIQHLMIPLSEWGLTSGERDAAKAYLENNVSEFGVRPDSVYFDGSELEEIYPSIEKATIGNLYDSMESGAEYRPDLSVWDRDDRLDEIVSVSGITDDGQRSSSGNKYTQVQYHNTKSHATNEYENFSQYLIENFGLGYSGKITIDFRGLTATVTDNNGSVQTLECALVAQVGGRRTSVDVAWTKSGNIYTLAIPSISFTANSGERLYVSLYVNFRSNRTNAPVAFSVLSRSAAIQYASDYSNTFVIRIPQVGFDIASRSNLGSEGIATIAMRDGMCGGRSFAVKSCSYVSSADAWDITVYRGKDEGLDMLFPNTGSPINAGDHFVILDIAMPDTYIGIAEQRLLTAGLALLEDLSRIKPFYEPEINSKYVYENSLALREGWYMPVKDTDITAGLTEYVLIDTLTISEGESNIPTYRVTLREQKRTSYTNTGTASGGTSMTSLANGGPSSGTSSGGIVSVGLTMPEQFSVEGSPVAGTGTIAVSLNPLYAIPTSEQVASIAILASMLEVKNYASGKWAVHVKPTALDSSGTMRTIDGIFSDGFVSAGGIGPGGGGGGEGGINTIAFGSKSYSAQAGSTAIVIPTTGADSVKVPLGITSLESRVTALENAPQGGVTSFGGVTGAITVRGGQTANGSVNLSMSGTQLQAAIVGLGSLAFKSSLAASDIPSLTISKITGLQDALDGKQAVISDLASIRSGAAAGATALQSASIKTLTIQKNGTQVGTYNPLTASTINITDVASASTLAALKSWIESMFEKDTTSIPGTTLIKAKYSLYSEGAITAGGVGSGGGGSTGALYTCVDVTAYNNSKVGRDSTHPAQSGDLLAYDGNKWHAVVAPATGVTSFGGKSGEITLGSNLAMTGNQVGLTGVITTSNIAQQAVAALTTPSLRTETDIVESGLRTYYGIGGTWTGSITSMAYAAIIALGPGTGRGLQIWARRGAGITASLHYRVPNADNTEWASERIVIDSENYTTYCAAASALSAHTSNTSNPHSVTKAQVGLGNVDNTADANKSVARAHGLTSVSITASFDLDTRLSGGGVVGNYGATSYWVNGPSGMGYGSVAQIQASADRGDQLALQLAWDINHNTTTPTRRLWFRASNNLGWQNDWMQIYHSGNLTAATLGAETTAHASATYLPLTGGKINGNLQIGLDDNTAYKYVRVVRGGYYAELSVANRLSLYLSDGTTSHGLYILSDGRLTYDLTQDIYHSGNSNKSDVAWACSTLTANSKAILGSLYDNSAALGRALSYGVMIGVGSVYGTAIWSTSNGNGHIQVQRFDGSATVYNLCLQEFGGNVGIGTNSPSMKFDAVQTGNVWTGRFLSDNSVVYLANGSGGGLFIGKKGTSGYLLNLRYNETSLGSGGDMAFYISGSGSVGIGTETPSQKLHVVGNIVATGAITAGAASDARLKDNIRNLANAVAVLKSLRPVSFDWNATATSNYSALKGHDVGLVAQEVEPYIPSAIGTIFGDYKRLDYTKVTPYLIAGWQDHESRIEVLERENAELKRRLNIN